jgi:hypothetical protein
VELTEKVLERLGTTESTTLVLKHEEGGKIRVASLLWEAPKAILRGDVLEVRNVRGSPHSLARPATTINRTRRSRSMTPTARQRHRRSVTAQHAV